MIGSSGSNGGPPGRRLGRQLRCFDAGLGTVEASLIEVVIDGLRATVWGEDGHVSINAWVRANSGWSDARISRCVRNARMCIDAPQVVDALRDGRVTVDRVDVLSRAWANPRVRSALVEYVDDFLDHAASVSQREFELMVRRWVNLMDVDGAHRDAVDGHAARFMTVSELPDGTVMFRGELTGAQAAELLTVLQRYAHAEFLSDHDQAVATHGPAYTKEQLARTHRQRLVDALAHMALDAASTPADATEPEPVLVVHLDGVTLAKLIELLHPTDDQVLALYGVGSLTLQELNEQLRASMHPARLRADTRDGHVLPLADVLAALIIGKVRVVVEDERGVIIHAGHAKRLFTGVQRDLVLAAATRCVYAGCDRPASWCQADHLQPYSHAGPTDIDNGGPGCRHHNTWRHRHRYRVVRDAHGRWHTYRPDGSEV